MALVDVVRNLNCGASNAGEVGLGLKHCKQDIKRAVTFLLTEQGYKFEPVGGEMNLAYINELVQIGKAKVLQGVIEMTDNTAEDTIVTRAGSGIKSVAGKMPYEYMATFDNGLNFHKALSALSSNKAYDITIFDSKGDMFFTETKQGDYKGFTLGMFEAGKYTMSDGSNSASQMVSFQMINRTEFDERVSWITSENLDFSPEDLNDYNDVTLQIVAPTNSSTDLLVNVISYADNKPVFIDGLIKDDFILTLNGTNLPILTATATSVKGQYNLTLNDGLATGNQLKLKLYDATLLADVIDADGVLYKSNVAESVVV